MSKFDELCKEYAGSREKYFRYRDECYEVAGAFIDGLINFLGCSREVISFHPVKDEDEKPGMIYSLMGVMKLQEDTYWHFGMGILAYEAPNVSPKQMNLFEIALKKREGKFVVRITPDGRDFPIDEKIPSTFEPAYEEIFRLMIARYKNGLERFLEHNDQVRKIGFGPAS